MSRIDEIRERHEKIRYANGGSQVDRNYPCELCYVLLAYDALTTENTTFKARLDRAEAAIRDMGLSHRRTSDNPHEECKTCKKIADYRR